MKNKVPSNAPSHADQQRGVLYQVSLLQGLANGDYDGSVTVGELKRHGDTGLGTFDRLNGEMILLDGKVYRVSGDGCVSAVAEDETSPFCVAAFLEADASMRLWALSNDALLAELDQTVAARGKNRFHMIRIDGTFQKIHVRSVHAQQKPYVRLTDALERDQTFFEYESIEGTAVGLYCPPYLSQLNAVGWHIHFISKDKSKGGHVLGMNVADAVLTWDDIHAFELRLPPSARFDRFDLTVDQSKDIQKIERNR